MKMEKSLVSICMITYQHGNFIGQALQGVLNQLTNFNYEIVIRDDASMDTTSDIISDFANQHPEKIRVLSGDENLGMIKNFKTVIKACDGKYIAFCEGDDYWIDSRKLARQVAMMEENSEMGFVYTNYSITDAMGNFILEKKYVGGRMPQGDILREIIKGEFPYTVTVCVRRDTFLDQIDHIVRDDYRMGDYPLWLHIANSWEVGYLPEVTSVYRRHALSYTANEIDITSKIGFNDSWIKILNDFIERENISGHEVLSEVREEISKRVVQNYTLSLKGTDKKLTEKLWQNIEKRQLKQGIKIKIIRMVQSIPFVGSRLLFQYFKMRGTS